MSRSGQSTRERILSRALSLFAENGYEGTTVQDIARAVGIKAASLYAHFPGKKAIFRAVFDRALGSWDGAVADSLSAAPKKCSLEEGLAEILGRYAWHATQAETYRFWARLYIFPPAVLKEKDVAAFRSLDMKFVEELFRYCRSRMPGTVKGADVTPFVTSLVRLAWGFVLCGAPTDMSAMKKELREGVRLLVKGHRSP